MKDFDLRKYLAEGWMNKPSKSVLKEEQDDYLVTYTDYPVDDCEVDLYFDDSYFPFVYETDAKHFEGESDEDLKRVKSWDVSIDEIASDVKAYCDGEVLDSEAFSEFLNSCKSYDDYQSRFADEFENFTYRSDEDSWDDEDDDEEDEDDDEDEDDEEIEDYNREHGGLTIEEAKELCRLCDNATKELRKLSDDQLQKMAKNVWDSAFESNPRMYLNKTLPKDLASGWSYKYRMAREIQMQLAKVAVSLGYLSPRKVSPKRLEELKEKWGKSHYQTTYLYQP